MRQYLVIFMMSMALLDQAYAEAEVPHPWPLSQLLTEPAVRDADAYPDHRAKGMRALIYESVHYRGRPTQIFAYYGVPEGAPPPGGFPAIVLAHGGGGTAYVDYVKMWNRRGYAAISMDLYGKLPAPGIAATERRALPGGYPFGDKTENPTEEWTYHAVSAIVLAHSLIRTFPEVDRDRIGLVGTSWGGIHSCIAAALDPRFRVVVSVYGCGFLSQGDKSIGFHRMYRDALPWWDPSHFLPEVKTPFFWIAGTDDGDFSPDMWQQSINITPGTEAESLIVKLGHSDEGQAYPLVAEMVGSILKNERALPRLEPPVIEGCRISVRYQSAKPLLHADLCYTADRGDRAKRVWQTRAAKIEDAIISAEVPVDAMAFFINAYDKRGTIAPLGDAWPVSSEYIERP